jgi:phospholipid/cholesterol/gamma-HCH transport system permease protein
MSTSTTGGGSTRVVDAPVAVPPHVPDDGEASVGQKVWDSHFGWLDQIAGMMLLTGKAVVATFTPPYSWTEEFVEEAWLILRRCLIPMIIATTAFAFGAPGVQASNITQIFGTLDREGAFFVMASVRELAGWINGMVIAGVGGTAICADLGARKVREELDAMAVLGLDPVRQIVTPRFLALGIVTPLMNVIAVVFGLIGGWMATVIVWGETSAGYIATFTSNFTLPDLLGSVLKTTGFGFIIAIACCYKGLNVRGGAQGVGRAVNQAVVIAFAGIWVFNYLFTAILLAAYPETGNLH